MVVVEGIKLIGLPVKWDASIWVSTPIDVRERRFLERRVENRRMQETSTEVLQQRFRIWADDAAKYEEKIRPHERPDVNVIEGDIPQSEQLAKLRSIIVELLK